MDINTLLQKYPNLRFLKNMPDYIREYCIIKKYPPKSILFHKDEELKFMYILCKGQVRAINSFTSGNIYMIKELEKFQVLGDIALMANKKNASVTIECITECFVFAIPRYYFNKWIDNDIELFKYLAGVIAQRLYESSYNKGFELNYPAVYRIKNFIIVYAEMKRIERGNQIIISKTRLEMADELKTTVKTINRAIKSLKEENLISIVKGKISINYEKYINLKKSIINDK